MTTIILNDAVKSKTINKEDIRKLYVKLKDKEQLTIDARNIVFLENAFIELMAFISVKDLVKRVEFSDGQKEKTAKWFIESSYFEKPSLTTNDEEIEKFYDLKPLTLEEWHKLFSKTSALSHHYFIFDNSNQEKTSEIYFARYNFMNKTFSGYLLKSKFNQLKDLKRAIKEKGIDFVLSKKDYSLKEILKRDRGFRLPKSKEELAFIDLLAKELKINSKLKREEVETLF